MKHAVRLSHSECKAGQASRGHNQTEVHTSPCSSTGTSIATKLALVGALLSLLSIPTFQGLWTVWSSRADASHGFLIPLIAGVLIRQRWPELCRLPYSASPGLGIPLIALSLTGLLLGSAGAVVSLSGLSFIGLASGLAVGLFGAGWFRKLAFPLGYLVLMVPVLDSVIEPLQQHFQLVTATMARLLLTQFAVPVFQSGTMLHLPTGTVQVAAECSGVGFLISILAIGLPLAMLGLRTWPMRTALIALTLALSLGTNWLRVALIALSGHLWGWGADLHGPLHLLHAMSVYWIGLGLLLGGLCIGHALERRLPRIPTVVHPHTAHPLSMNALPRWDHTWAATCMLMGAALVLLYAPQASSTHPPPALSQLPHTIGEWVWDDSVHSLPLITVGHVDQEILRTYRHSSGDQVQVYVAYIAAQSQGKELVNHHTQRLHRQAFPVSLTTGEGPLTVNHTTWEESRHLHDVVFWYQAQGRIMTDRVDAKLATALSSLIGGGSEGALIVLSRRVTAPQSATQSLDDPLARFTLLALPILRAYLP